MTFPPILEKIRESILSWRLNQIAVWIFFLALCTSQYGNQFIITFPLNISQLLMITGCAVMLFDNDRLRAPKIALPMALLMGIISFGINFNPNLVPVQLKTIFGIFIYFTFSYSIIRKYRKNLWDFIWIYYRIALIEATFAITQVVVWVATGYSLAEPVLKSQLGGFINFRPEAFGLLPRAIGLHREPAHLVAFLLPSLYFSLQRLFGHPEMRTRVPLWCAWVIFIGYSLTFSLNAYVGLLAILLSVVSQKYRQHKAKLALAILFACTLFISAGLAISSLRVRLIQLVSFDPRQLDSNNLSTFAFLSNGLVTFQALISSKGFGFGINSHADSYDKFLGKFFSAFQVVMRLNTDDAASLYFRLLSEFGVLGLASFLILIRRSSYRQGGIREQINRMGGLVVLVVAIRNGSYMEQITWLGLCLVLVTSEQKTKTLLPPIK